MKVFPEAPSNIWYVLLIFGTVSSSLFLDNVLGVPIGPVEWFISVVGVPILFITVASRRENVSLLEFLSFRGDILFAASMFFLGMGFVSLMFSIITQPLALAFKGTSLWKAITVLYMPLSSKRFWLPLASISTGITASLIFYLVVAIFEEIWKFASMKIIANWLYQRFAIGKNLIIVLGFVISCLFWLASHFIAAWVGVEVIPAILMGLFLSFIFISPFFLGEDLISPE
ncbi:MAG: hypothetical protein ACTSWZ_07825, partial [Candidatus Heimdallarchaeaceae archaeon]